MRMYRPIKVTERVLLTGEPLWQLSPTNCLVIVKGTTNYGRTSFVTGGNPKTKMVVAEVMPSLAQHHVNLGFQTSNHLMLHCFKYTIYTTDNMQERHTRRITMPNLGAQSTKCFEFFAHKIPIGLPRLPSKDINNP
jgi:hypothetical protein